ncbi:ABC transporter substrate-binding protein [Dehalobacter sp. DCM]|uniref:ABC transporter substrate-binding protein n=1 Tax=Dehalobacter sp. DCM TaxID=2907827 RepID=UPI0030817DD7|nr:ABC transporter substrate-binding protein [Dehalobacter sp. DCM]
MKRRLSILLVLMLSLTLVLTGCSSSKKFDENASFDTLVSQAKGSTVTFYGWGGDDLRNNWLDNVVAPALKEKYNITLNRVPMDIDQILSKLSGEKQAGTTDGTIDLIWINGENFYSAKDKGYLYGPFTQKLPNYAKYIDQTAAENLRDFGYTIDGYEAPYGKAQMVMINDSAATPETPKNTAELLAYCKANKGKVTYPALPDFTGSAFVRSIICDIVGYEQFADMPADKATVKNAIQPAIDYLTELNPYLWREGKTFPATIAQVDNMFADNELVMTMSYEPYSAATKIANGTYKATATSFLFDKGMVGNTNYIAIAQNSPNKAGALVVVNEMISAEIQASQFSKLRSLPVVDYNKLSDDEKKLFDSVDLGQGSIPQDILLSKRVPEMPAKLIPIIEEIWLEEVVGK